MYRVVSLTTLLVAVLGLVSAVAQSPGTDSLPMRTLAATSGYGISNAPALDRPEVRVLRVDVGPDGVRYVHTHDDVQYHLFIPLTGTVRLEVGNEKPVEVGPWQATFIKGGTRHGFTGAGGATVTVMEVFVKK